MGGMAECIDIVFETHSWSEDNERGLASGWMPTPLSPKGRGLAQELGERRRHDGLAAVFVSDLRRAAETAAIAFAGTDVPVFHDWRLRECDYGDLTGRPAPEVHGTVAGVHDPYPGGESWAAAIRRVGGALNDIHGRWRGHRVLVIGHMSAYWALRHFVDGMPLEDFGKGFEWQEGWELRMCAPADLGPAVSS
ncbi:MAG: putative phosphoglycerate mutase [uncultured Acidimicrobiales bacterium]|uniref:phosphoglycerate mutase (2,3-diphosphoglycerate-dependent) n=1 Tax=uncultured Acidimicrobiales bacterium TaxID=310071 RepID=A0A6J4HE46_9ACTN|nr:MAG: putative phosphoglycerate mutase [uncultured Acidimicrobiales bacterium]